MQETIEIRPLPVFIDGKMGAFRIRLNRSKCRILLCNILSLPGMNLQTHTFGLIIKTLAIANRTQYAQSRLVFKDLP